jgi:hypothetical protein
MSDGYNPQLERLKRRKLTGAAYKRSRKQEAENVERLQGRAIPASGSRFRKGDTEKPDIVRVECKSTEHKSFRVTRGMMQKVYEACILENQVPAIEVEFVDNVSNVLDSYYVMRRADAERLIMRIADAEGISSPDKRDCGNTKLHNSKLAAPKCERGVQDTRLRRPRNRRP